MTYRTEQERFWAGEFGNDYIARNQGDRLLASNVALFSRILRAAPGVRSLLELGCNIGMNLQALHRIDPSYALCGIEINQAAAEQARARGIADIVEGTIIDPLPRERRFDLTFTKGVLIHIHPDELNRVYDNLVAVSRRYVLVCEYYNPTPVTVTYRGNENRLFKRDFAGELIDLHGLRLVDYGFVYHRDAVFPQDDPTWFLLEKAAAD